MQIGSVSAILTAKVKDFTNAFKKAETSLSEFGSRGKRLEDQLKNLQRRKELITQKMKAFELAGRKGTIQYKSLENQLSNVSDKIKTQGVKISEFISKQGRLLSSTDSLSSRFGRFKDNLDKLKFKFRDVRSAADELGGKGLTGLGKALGGLKGVIGGAIPIIGGLAIGITGIATGAFALATKTAGDFQTEMLKVKAISSATGDQFEQLIKQAKDLGRTTQFQAKQVGEAQKFQAMAGLEVNEILSATPGILNLAAAANLDLGRSSDIATNIMSQFGKEASDMNNIVDVLAKTVNTSNQDMEQLADAMNYLGPTAKAMGIQLEEAAAVTGILASNGLQGSLGTRALGTSLTRLSKPTANMQTVMKKLNLQAFDSKGNFAGIEGVVSQLEKSMKGLTQEQKQNYLSTLFGAEAIQEWNILLANGSGNLSKYTEELRNSTGAAGDMAGTMMSGYQGAMMRFQSAWEGLLISLGESGIIDLVSVGFGKFATVLTILGNKIETFFKPKMQALMESLRSWYNTGGKEAIQGFLNDAWNGFTDSIRWFINDVWPGLKDALIQFGDYVKSEKFKNNLRTVGDIVRGIGDAFKWTYDQITKATQGFRDWQKQSEGNKAFLQSRQGGFSLPGSGAIGTLFGMRRANGGPVSPGNLYEVGENNKAEMLQMNGKQYMIPGNKGEVLNQEQMAKRGGNSKTTNIYNYIQSTPKLSFYKNYQIV
jgi:TP901 family phage tail tape measure protein